MTGLVQLNDLSRVPLSRNSLRSGRGVCCPHCEAVFSGDDVHSFTHRFACAECGERFRAWRIRLLGKDAWISTADYVVNEDGMRSPC